MIALSLFDYTGAMLKPWASAGYDCYAVDIQHSGISKREGITFVGADVREWEMPFDCRDVAVIFAFPPCTDVAVSGAAHFKKKGLKALIGALELFDAALDIIDKCDCAYFLENPVSTVSTYWRKPDYMFNPCDYGGYLPEDDLNPVHSMIPARDAYKKRTCLWTGNGFVMPEKKEVEVNTSNHIHNALGGKSLRTKNIRSATPRGFAAAVFQFNRVD